MDKEPVLELPDLDAMLQSLLLMEEGEHEFVDEDVDELRQLFFPVLREGIYLKHAVMGPLSRPTTQVLREYVDDVSRFGGVHEESWKQYRDGAHRRMASLLHAHAGQIAFTASSHDSLKRLAYALDWHDGDTMLLIGDEVTVDAPLWLDLESRGVNIQIVSTGDQPFTSDVISSYINKQTRLVCLRHMLPTPAFRSDIAVLAAYCRERAIICGIDATYALGALEVDVQQLGVDYLVAEGHRWLLAPQSCGILYLSSDLLARLPGAAQAMGMERFEYGAPNSFPLIGLDAALGVLEAIDGGMQAIEARIVGLCSYAIAGLERLGYPHNEGKHTGMIYFTSPPERRDLSVQKLLESLAERNIHLAMHKDMASISPHFYNTPEEIDALLKVLEELKRATERG